MCKLLANIRDSPNQVKYRQVKKSNPAIQNRLFAQCFDLLCAAGFEDAGDLLCYRAEPGLLLQEAVDTINSLLLSLNDVDEPSSKPASSSTAMATATKGPLESKRALQQQRHEKAKEETQRAQASAQGELAALRHQRASQYQEQQDAALARHLGSLDADAPYDTITALNASRGAVHSFVTCTRCGSSLRYNSGTHAQAVLCPCGMLLQPIHLQGQPFAPRSPSDLPVEPGEPVDHDNRPRTTRGPFISVRGPDGETTRLPLYAVLQMVRQQGERQTVGAGDETIEALPTRTYEAGDNNSVEHSNNCQICMEDFAEGDELRTLPCFHLFHSHCVDQWLKVNSICPTCRHKIG